MRWLERDDQWPGLKSIAAVRSERRIGKRITSETRYFISSLAGRASKIVSAAREHWAIENSLHHVLDVTMNEDASRIRKGNASENLATLRKIVLNLVRRQRNTKTSVRARLKRVAWDEAYLAAILVA